MHDRFEQRIEESLIRMSSGCKKRRYQVKVIERRVGKLLGKNSRAAGLFDIKVDKGENGGAMVSWKKRDDWRDWARLSEGCYMLRSNIRDWSPEDLWKAYIQLTEAEDAFRIQKNDLKIRPIWHQKGERVLSHILVCFLSYVLWKTLEGLCRQAGLGDEPRKVFHELSRIKLTDVVLPTRNGKEIRLRCIGTPTKHQQILLQHLKLNLPNPAKPEPKSLKVFYKVGFKKKLWKRLTVKVFQRQGKISCQNFHQYYNLVTKRFLNCNL